MLAGTPERLAVTIAAPLVLYVVFSVIPARLKRRRQRAALLALEAEAKRK